MIPRKNKFVRYFQTTIALLILILVISRFWYGDPSHDVVQMPSLSADKKSILVDGVTAFSVGDTPVVEYFQQKSELCNESNIDNDKFRRSFCKDTATLAQVTRFVSIVVSPDARHVGFTIESDVLTPDTVAGIFSKENVPQVEFLTDYYLGNKFLGFSPEGTYFAYHYGCFEGNCAFQIKNTVTGKDMITFISQYADARGDYKFSRWISENEIEYTLDGVPARFTW